MNTVITTPELFRLLSLSIGKEKPATPYMVAKVLGVAQTTAIAWSRGYGVMDEKNADKVAEMLGLDREVVQLSLEAERKERAGLSEIAAIFARAAEQVSRRAAAVFLGVFLLFSALPSPAQAHQVAQASAGGLYIMLNLMRRFGRLLKALQGHSVIPAPCPAI